MSEERTPAHTVAFRQGRRRTAKIEIFRKSQWTHNKADDYMYRCRIDRVWYGGTHGDMLFLDSESVLPLIKKALTEGGVV